MKKIFLTPAVLLAAVLFLNCEISLATCSQKTTGDITGGACSIEELRNLESKRANAGLNFGFNPKGEKDLRPVRLEQPNSKKTGDRCLFGLCLYKSLLGG